MPEDASARGSGCGVVYDRSRLLASHPVRRDALTALVGGIASGVISYTELVRCVGHRDLDEFLQKYLGERLPTTVLRDALRRMKSLGLDQGKKVESYRTIHDAARRRRHGFGKISVALGRTMRRERFAWSTDVLLGINRFREYLDAVDQCCDDLGIGRLTTYGRYEVFVDLRPEWAIHQRIARAEFPTLRAMAIALADLNISAVEKTLFSLPDLRIAASERSSMIMIV